jgi:anti-sigma-K factor RskA
MKFLVGTEKISARDVSRRADQTPEILLTVYFFQGELLSLADETEDHEPSDEVEARVEAN